MNCATGFFQHTEFHSVLRTEASVIKNQWDVSQYLHFTSNNHWVKGNFLSELSTLNFFLIL